jgi:hypothetical protein
MSTYSQATKQLGDLWVDALKRAEEAVSTAAKSRPQATLRPAATVRRTGLRQELPSLHEVVQANFELAERVLKAQKHYALKAIEAAFPESAKPAKAHHEPRKPAAPRRKRTTRARTRVPTAV